jgi:hypothetical protein
VLFRVSSCSRTQKDGGQAARVAAEAVSAAVLGLSCPTHPVPHALPLTIRLLLFAEELARHLSTAALPAALGEPDLLIRTSGEQRLSDFLLWELAYTEFYFTEACWPDFGERQLRAAVVEYAARNRRYGEH